jgi:hypothetical protein
MLDVATSRKESWELGAELLPLHLHTSDLMKLFGVSQHTVLQWHATCQLEADQPPTPGSRQPFRYPRSRVIKFATLNALELNLEALDLVTESAEEPQ